MLLNVLRRHVNSEILHVYLCVAVCVTKEQNEGNILKQIDILIVSFKTTRHTY